MKNNFFSFLSNDAFFIILGIITIIPFTILSFFYNPGSDDFDYAYESQTENFFPLQIRRYNEWSGRYFSNGIISFDPLTYNNYFFLKIVPILLFLLFIYSLFFFFTSPQLKIKKKKILLIVSTLFVLYLYQMPNVCEGFYWMPGSITNQLPISLSLLFFGLMTRCFDKKRFYHIPLLILLLAAIIGCNEIIIVILGILLSVLWMVYFIKNKKVSIIFSLLLLFFILFSAIEILAPGNTVRASIIPVEHDFFYSVLKSVQFSFKYFFRWFSFIAITILFFVDEIIDFIKDNQFKAYFLHPLIVLVILLIMMFVVFFLGFWTLHSVIPDRSINTLYFFYIILLGYLCISVISFFKLEFNSKNNSLIKIALGIVILTSFLADNNIMVAYNDLLTGKAYNYDKEMKNRIEILKNSKEKQCILPVLTNFPVTIYNSVTMGLTNDKNNWKNKEIMRYYRKESIIVKPIDSLLTE